MISDKVIKRVAGAVTNTKEKYLDNLDKLSVPALNEALDRQKKLLEDSDSYISSKVASAVELLNHFSVDELKIILNDASKFDDVMKDIIDCKDAITDKEVLIASNKSLAEFNLAKEGTMLELKRDISELSREGERLYRSVEEKMSKVGKSSGPNNLEDVLALLQTKAATTEEESESLATQFLNGDIDVDSFLEQFINKRKSMHLRRVKADKMTEMVRRRVSRSEAHLSPNPGSVAQHPPFYPASPQSTPYPMGPVTAMPLPTANHFNNFF